MLAGECTLVVEEQERPLRQWDFFHCPAGTRHVSSARRRAVRDPHDRRPPEDEELLYPVSEVAAKYGASAAKDTPNPDEAYADWPGEFVPVRLPWPVD